MRKYLVSITLASVFGFATLISCNKSGDGSPRNVTDSEKVIELKLKGVPEEGKAVWFFAVAQNTIETADEVYAYNDSILKVMPPEGEPKFTLIAFIPDEKSWTPVEGFMSGNYAKIIVDKTITNIKGTSATKVGYFVKSWGHIDAVEKPEEPGVFEPIEDFSSAGVISSVVAVKLGDLDDDYEVDDVVKITASASDKDGGYIKSVTFDVAGQTFFQTQEPFYADFNTHGKTPGKYTVKVIAINGNEYGDADVKEFILKRPANGKAPSISFTSPSQGAEVTIGTKITVDVNASDADGKITSLQVSVDGVMIGTSMDDKGAYSFDWNPYGQPNSIVVISATAKDDSGNERTAHMNVKLISKD